ncbi:hypothetical protein NK718_07210 [Alsobacter sp. SYSU M60028]|uniref:DUF3592 domain-containing protein n=1 Tax=Alsobacter ponti TaxID=2962936 RepID=A0ABT1LA08_9HYPH|nr:hypothetical protein [Alsobacter ponti]MCP8938299.1 hypothetical protein [Alsobacter ponti]
MHSIDQAKRRRAQIDVAAFFAFMCLFMGFIDAMKYWDSKDWPLVEFTILERNSRYDKSSYKNRWYTYKIEYYWYKDIKKSTNYNTENPFLIIGNRYDFRYNEKQNLIIRNSYWSFLWPAAASILFWIVMMTNEWGWVDRYKKWKAKYLA